jgi:hypothetical protein
LKHFMDRHRNDLFVSHNMLAEVAYLLLQGIDPPTRWFCTMIGYRFVTNQEVVPRYRLIDALNWARLPHAFAAEKDALGDRLGRLDIDPDDPAELRLIEAYCKEDCVETGRLYERLKPHVPETFMQFAADYIVELARMDRNGLMFDMRTYKLLLDRREEVIDAVVSECNTACPGVFTGGQLYKPVFFGWCADSGIGWPLTWSHARKELILSLDAKVRSSMADRHPFIRKTHEAAKTVTRLNQRGLAVDHGNGRHYGRHIPYAQSSSRTSLKANVFQGPRWMRHLVVPSSRDHVLLAADVTAEEIGLAAHLSNDSSMMQGYREGDAHMSFAILAGAAPVGAKAEDPRYKAVRKQFKQANLAVNYGQGPDGLARQTGMHLAEAEALLAQHQRVYATYHTWRRRYISNAFAQGCCHTIAGWPRQVSRSDNCRSIGNFPVQGGGADLMRLGVIYLSRAGLKLLAVVHDSFVIECHRKEIREVKMAINAALGRAASQLVPGCPLTWTIEEFAERYEDEHGKDLWDMIYGMLHSRKSGRRARCLVNVRSR